MMNGNSEEYIQAYTEVNCLLNCFPQELIDKVPTNVLNMIKSKSEEKYKIQVDTQKRIDENNICKKTKDILAVLKYNYWSTEEEKEWLKNKFAENDETFQEKKIEKSEEPKFDYDSLFKKKKSNIENKEQIVEENVEKIAENKVTENVTMTVHKDTWISKIINKIKSLFRRNKK